MLLGGPSLIARYGWHVGLGCSVVSAFSFAFLAPRDAPRYGHCGFAVGSVLAIVRSFFWWRRSGSGFRIVRVACGLFIRCAGDDGAVGPRRRPRPFLRVDAWPHPPSTRRRRAVASIAATPRDRAGVYAPTTTAPRKLWI